MTRRNYISKAIPEGHRRIEYVDVTIRSHEMLKIIANHYNVSQAVALGKLLDLGIDTFNKQQIAMIEEKKKLDATISKETPEVKEQ